MSSRRRPESAHETASDGEGVVRALTLVIGFGIGHCSSQRCAGLPTTHHVRPAPDTHTVTCAACAMPIAMRPSRAVAWLLFKFIVCHRRDHGRDSDRDHTHIGKVESSKPSDTSTVPVNACPRVPAPPVNALCTLNCRVQKSSTSTFGKHALALRSRALGKL